MQVVLDNGINTYQVHGVSATVVFSDNHIWTGVSGLSHDSVSIKPDMLFAVGSITKNIIAALTLKLVEEEKLSLDDPISNWLPPYPYVDSRITIRQLLNHTSGLYMFWENQKIWDELKRDRKKFWSPEEVLQYIKEPYFLPGNGWRYSNTNYLLLAMILEKVTDSNLSNELKKRFWKPLRLKNVYLSQEETIPSNQAHIYGDNFQFGSQTRDITFEPRTSHESITYGSSGIFTTSKDLAIWSHALFEGKVLNEDLLNEMLTFVEFSPVGNMRAYGLGVEEFTKGFTLGKFGIGHGGGNIGTTTYMVYLPNYHVSIVVMINAFPNKGANVITTGIIKEILLESNEYGIPEFILQYFDYYRFGYFALLAVVVWAIVIAYHVRKKMKRL